MKIAAALAALLLAVIQDSKDASGADVDGPYLFEAEGGGWTSKRIAAGGVAKVEKLAGSEFDLSLSGKTLKVRIRAAAEPPPYATPAPERLLALSDIEGNLDALIRLLRAGGVIDDDFAWTFGKGRVVVVGDVFDRGLQVTECLWLLYELEARAAAAGGGVHFILGNHEVMNLTDDFRYVRKKYRENAKLLELKLADLYSRSTVLGRWLRTRNAIEKIGDELFVHGGISAEAVAAGHSMTDLNDALRKALLAESWEKPRSGPAKLAVDGKLGPLWYRGYFKDPISSEAMESILKSVGATRLIVGHTVAKEIGFALGGRVLAIDVAHAEGTSQAALREGGAWFRVKSDGTKEKLEAGR